MFSYLCQPCSKKHRYKLHSLSFESVSESTGKCLLRSIPARIQVNFEQEKGGKKINQAL